MQPTPPISTSSKGLDRNAYFCVSNWGKLQLVASLLCKQVGLDGADVLLLSSTLPSVKVASSHNLSQNKHMSTIKALHNASVK
jgi:hypothetical protein